MNEQELKRAIELIKDGLDTDGAHHKQWYLALLLEALAPTEAADRARLGYDMGICP